MVIMEETMRFCLNSSVERTLVDGVEQCVLFLIPWAYDLNLLILRQRRLASVGTLNKLS